MVNLMASEQRFHELIGRAIADASFRSKLATDPKKAAQDAGVELTEQQIAYLKTIDLKSVSEILDRRTSKTVR